MKSLKKLLGMALVASMVLVSCEKTEDTQDLGSIKDLSEAAQKYLGVQGDVQKSKSENQDNNKKLINGVKSSVMTGLKSTNEDGDSTNIDWNYGESCAKVTEGTDEEGFTYIIYDYGTEGCEEWGYLTKGKTTYKWKESMEGSKSNYECVDLNENYESGDFFQNGFYKWKGSYDVNSWDFEGESASDIVYRWGSEEFRSKSNFKDIYTENSYTILEGNDFWEEANGKYSYSMKVIKPVVYNYTCEESYAPVSGVEEIESVKDGVKAKFSIDYGDGKCDNIVKVTENGKTIEIDLYDLYDKIYETADSTKTN